MQIARDEANFKEFMDKLRAEKERDETRKKTSHENKYKYREEILSQITEKQRKRREEEERQKREQLAQVDAARQREQLSIRIPFGYSFLVLVDLDVIERNFNPFPLHSLSFPPSTSRPWSSCPRHCHS